MEFKFRLNLFVLLSLDLLAGLLVLFVASSLVFGELGDFLLQLGVFLLEALQLCFSLLVFILALGRVLCAVLVHVLDALFQLLDFLRLFLCEGSAASHSQYTIAAQSMETESAQKQLLHTSSLAFEHVLEQILLEHELEPRLLEHVLGQTPLEHVLEQSLLEHVLKQILLEHVLEHDLLEHVLEQTLLEHVCSSCAATH